jgi:hypothetical protein
MATVLFKKVLVSQVAKIISRILRHPNIITVFVRASQYILSRSI